MTTLRDLARVEAADAEQLLLIRGVIASAPADIQLAIKMAEHELRAVLLKHGEPGIAALALIGAEEAAKP